ncbi:DUF2326 domain-containing protein [Spirosoma endbachense]|uniref:DUF2326 domain-containing protein n=1 Tax=Spirosoma endbachense TaxID=2666025 RepID=A0A6P1VYX3_9BACT|nr:DUF2326 domain-containing protein [Spirosoma endbachense]QHV97302.1 DUF2326 domain-containing protein [Spirosoma endbachense]
MRLLKLSSNKASFQTVEFNRKGISLIIGKRADGNYQSDNKKSTYNSVGKSLTIALIHFCLGSHKNAEFESKLEDWSFSLSFEINEITYTATRFCNDQQVIWLNNESIKLDDYKKKLADLVFIIPKNIKNLTFRSLIARFIRPQKESYNSYDVYKKKEQDYDRLLNNAFLLGLDVNLMADKYNLKDEYDKLDNLRRSTEKDPVLKSFFEGDRDLSIDITDLKQKVARLRKSLDSFRIADDYYAVLREVNVLKGKVAQIESTADSYRIALRNIDDSLKIQPDIPRDKVLELYQEAVVSLNDAVKRRLEEVEEFHRKIIENRSKRLTTEKKRYENQLRKFDSDISTFNKEKDRLTEYLKGKGALDEFTSLNNQVRDYEIQLDKLETYRKLINEYKRKLEEIKLQVSEENLKTSRYIEHNYALLETNILLFRSFVDQFYSDKSAGIQIEINDDFNRQRFDIRARIDDDKGDGVGAVKIFCFDWTLLEGKHNHNVNFLFHDSRLLSEIDSHQVATLFQVAYDKTQVTNFQYIISSNQNIIDSLREEYTQEEFTKYIEDSTILELTDESHASKLLGVQVDLIDYDN